jgi:hypothetical protein
MVHRRLSLIAVMSALAFGAWACAGGGDELNPQPLPPEDPDKGVPSSGENGSSGGANPAVPGVGSSDAGTAADGSDKGDAGGDT